MRDILRREFELPCSIEEAWENVLDPLWLGDDGEVDAEEGGEGWVRIVVLDNNLYHQYIVLARVYDWTRRGTQSFPVLIPQELTPGTISVDWAGAVTAEGKSYEGLKVTTSDIEVILYLDSNHKLIRLEVPSAKVSVVRE